MTNSWMNEDGEPIMDGAAWRFEQQLDLDSAHERYEDDFYSRYDDEPSCDEPDTDTLDEQGRMWCYACDEYADHTLPAEQPVIEDQWLDGSYEE